MPFAKLAQTFQTLSAFFLSIERKKQHVPFLLSFLSSLCFNPPVAVETPRRVVESPFAPALLENEVVPLVRQVLQIVDQLPALFQQVGGWVRAGVFADVTITSDGARNVCSAPALPLSAVALGRRRCLSLPTFGNAMHTIGCIVAHIIAHIIAHNIAHNIAHITVHIIAHIIAHIIVIL